MHRVAFFILIAIVFVTACAQQPTPAPATPTELLPEAPPELTPAITFTPEQPAATAATNTPARTPAPNASTPTTVASEGTTGGQVGQTWTLADLRYGVQDGRLRVVWEMAETGERAPRYDVRQVETESGTRIEVVLVDVSAAEVPLDETLPVEPAGVPTATRIDRLPTSDDASLGFVIELEAPAQYEVAELTGPVRVVVDVVYAGQ